MEGSLIMVARQPRPGQCKTRLCPPLAPAEAAALYEAFLTDLMGRWRRFAAAHGVRAGVAYTPSEAASWFHRHTPAGLELVAQQGQAFGERLENLARRCPGGGPVVIVSSDSPTLPEADCALAFERLREADVVLGPCCDGGYNLIGLRAFTPAVFRDIAWSTPQVLQQTVERASMARLRVHLLPEWYDVDTVEDLERLRAELTSTEGAAAAPVTAAMLLRLAAAPR